MRGLRGNPHRAGAAGHPAAWAGSDLQRSRKGFPFRSRLSEQRQAELLADLSVAGVDRRLRLIA